MATANDIVIANATATAPTTTTRTLSKPPHTATTTIYFFLVFFFPYFKCLKFSTMPLLWLFPETRAPLNHRNSA